MLGSTYMLSWCLAIAPQGEAVREFPQRQLVVYEAPIAAMVLDPKGERAYVLTHGLGDDSAVHAFDLVSRKSVWDTTTPAYLVDVAADKEQVFAIGTATLLFTSYDAASGRERKSEPIGKTEGLARSLGGTPVAIRCDADEQLVRIAFENGWTWNLPEGRRDLSSVSRFEIAGVRVMALDGKAQKLAIAGANGQVQLRDARNSKLLAKGSFQLDAAFRAITTIAFDAKSKSLIVGAETGAVGVVSSTGDRLARIEGHTAAVGGIAVHPAAKWVATCDASGRVCVWEPRDGKHLATASLPAPVPLAGKPGVTFVPNAKQGSVAIALCAKGDRLIVAHDKSLFELDLPDTMK